MSSVGIEMAVAMVLGLLFGRWLDSKFESEPWFTFVFLGVGILAAFRGLWRTTTEIQRSFATDKTAGASKPMSIETPRPERQKL